jgi:dATP pyrophosphohydrolase
MRAPFQILALPYKIVDGAPHYCVFHRADHDQWQFVAGGGEDDVKAMNVSFHKASLLIAFPLGGGSA